MANVVVAVSWHGVRVLCAVEKASAMGIPYSKQINAAFDEVTPLVAAGFSVLQTSKNISILLAAIQAVTLLLLSLILAALLALIATINPDLEPERKAIVTPVMRWIFGWLMSRLWLRIGVATVLLGSAIGVSLAWYFTPDTAIIIDSNPTTDEEGEAGQAYDT